MELEYPIKEKEDRIPLKKGPTISATRKGGPKKQTPGVLQFLSRITRILLYQTSIFALVLPFWIPYQRKEGRNFSEQGSYNFSHKRRRAEEVKPKGPAVSYQRKHYLKELLTLTSFIVVFVTSIYILCLKGTF